MRGRRSPYLQVLLTYCRRPAFRGLALAAICASILFVSHIVATVKGFQPSYWHRVTGELLLLATILVVFSPVVLLITFVATLMWHLREQLDTPGCDLVPGLRRANVNVGSAIFLSVPLFVCIGLWAFDQIVLAWQLHYGGYTGIRLELFLRAAAHERSTTFMLGLFAVALSLMTLTAVWASFRSPWLSLLMMPLFLFGLTWQPLGVFIDHLLSPAFSWDDANRIHSVELIGANVLLLFALRRKLVRPKRHRRERRGPATSSSPRELPDFALCPHRTVRSATSRVWHRRYGVLNPLAPWAVAGILAVLLLCVPLVVGVHQADLLRSLLLPTLVPGVVISAIWRERWLNLGYESLYPARRSQFVSELAVATAINLAELWIATTLAVLPATLIWQPRMLLSPTFSVTLAASAAMQVLVFGVMFVAARFRPLLPYINIVTILAMLIPISFTWASDPSLSPHGLLVVAAVEMAVGLVLAAWGSAAWCRADLA